jgi:hypothetical protein
MVEKQINEEFVSTHLQTVLTPDKCEAGAKFQQEAGDVPRQGLLDVALLRVLCQVEKVKDVRILERLAGEVGLRWRQSLPRRSAGLARPEYGLKVRDGASGSGVRARLGQQGWGARVVDQLARDLHLGFAHQPGETEREKSCGDAREHPAYQQFADHDGLRASGRGSIDA